MGSVASNPEFEHSVGVYKVGVDIVLSVDRRGAQFVCLDVGQVYVRLASLEVVEVGLLSQRSVLNFVVQVPFGLL